MNYQFTKMQGLGNDFVIFDGVKAPVVLTPEQIRLVCDRHRGIGCDQLLLVDVDGRQTGAFNYRIYNSDGSESGQCGNGARCVARYLFDAGHSGRQMALHTADDVLQAEVHENGDVTVSMGQPRFEPADVPFDADIYAPQYIVDVDGQSIELGAVSMGNPHAVIRVDCVDDAPVGSLGPRLEMHLRFPQRVNVGFAEIVNRNRIRLRVFERGAGETQACGSGACAAVVVASQRDWVDSRCEVELPGGVLHIEWRGGDNPVLMTGSAETVFNGNIQL